MSALNHLFLPVSVDRDERPPLPSCSSTWSKAAGICAVASIRHRQAAAMRIATRSHPDLAKAFLTDRPFGQKVWCMIMASTKEIKSRMDSVQDTQKITNAMYLIASTKLRKARSELEHTRPYFDALRGEIKRIFRTARRRGQPLFLPHRPRRAGPGRNLRLPGHHRRQGAGRRLQPECA